MGGCTSRIVPEETDQPLWRLIHHCRSLATILAKISHVVSALVTFSRDMREGDLLKTHCQPQAILNQGIPFFFFEFIAHHHIDHSLGIHLHTQSTQPLLLTESQTLP